MILNITDVRVRNHCKLSTALYESNETRKRSDFAKFVSIKKEAILYNPLLTEFILCRRCFTVRNPGITCAQKSAKTDHAKNPQDISSLFTLFSSFLFIHWQHPFSLVNLKAFYMCMYQCSLPLFWPVDVNYLTCV